VFEPFLTTKGVGELAEWYVGLVVP